MCVRVRVFEFGFKGRAHPSFERVWLHIRELVGQICKRQTMAGEYSQPSPTQPQTQPSPIEPATRTRADHFQKQGSPLLGREIIIARAPYDVYNTVVQHALLQNPVRGSDWWVGLSLIAEAAASRSARTRRRSRQRSRGRSGHGAGIDRTQGRMCVGAAVGRPQSDHIADIERR